MDSTFALRVRTKGTTAVWTFRPGDSQPVQVFNQGLHKLGPAALRVQVFIAENQRSAALTASLRCNPERARASEVEKTSGRWGEASAIGDGSGVRHGQSQKSD